jgi:hypothetical protein
VKSRFITNNPAQTSPSVLPVKHLHERHGAGAAIGYADAVSDWNIWAEEVAEFADKLPPE